MLLSPLSRSSAATTAALLLSAGAALSAAGAGHDSSATPLADVDRKLLAWSTKEARSLLEPAFDATKAAHLVAMGRLLEQEGKYGEAAERLTKACAAAPEDPTPLLYLGEVRQRQGQNGPAEEAFKRAAEKARKEIGADGANADAHYELGVAEQRLKRYDASATSLERARELRPQDPMPYFQLGVTRAFQERWQETVDLLSKAIERNSGIAYAYYYRGLAAGRVNRNDLMIDDLDRFVTLAPEAPEAERARRILQSVRR